MFKTAPPAADPLAPPSALRDAYSQLERALVKHQVVTWFIDVPDMCCDEHMNFGYDSVEPVDAVDLGNALTSAFVALGENRGHLFVEDDDDGEEIDNETRPALTSALYNALRGTTYPVGGFELSDLMAWARSAPVTYDELVKQAAHELLSGTGIGVPCTAGRAAVHLRVSERKTKYVRPMTDVEIGDLVRSCAGPGEPEKTRAMRGLAARWAPARVGQDRTSTDYTRRTS